MRRSRNKLRRMVFKGSHSRKVSPQWETFFWEVQENQSAMAVSRAIFIMSWKVV